MISLAESGSDGQATLKATLATLAVLALGVTIILITRKPRDPRV